MNAIGIIGLDPSLLLMASNMVKNGTRIICYDEDNTLRKTAVKYGLVTTSSVQGVILHLPRPKIVWITKTSAKTMEALIEQIAGLLEPGDIVLDATAFTLEEHSWRHHFLNERGINYLVGNVSR